MLGQGGLRLSLSFVVRLSVVAGLAAFLLLPLGAGTQAFAHGKEKHGSEAVQTVVVSARGGPNAADLAPADLDDALPVAFPVEIGGPFELVDHFGQPRGQDDFDGAYSLIFFGYAHCESICPVALKVMLDAADLLADAGYRVQPLLITVDPEGEPPAVLKAGVEAMHPRLLGLTGTNEQIDAVKKAFHVDSELVGTNIKGNKVFAHGSFIYLMGPDGQFLTLLPPILDAATMAEKLQTYL